MAACSEVRIESETDAGLILSTITPVVESANPKIRTWRCSRAVGMCSCSSPAPLRCTARPGRGSTTGGVYDWFAANLHRIHEPSLRHYVRARELKAAGMDWTEVLAAEAENPRARLAADLLASGGYKSTTRGSRHSSSKAEDAE